MRNTLYSCKQEEKITSSKWIRNKAYFRYIEVARALGNESGAVECVLHTWHGTFAAMKFAVGQAQKGVGVVKAGAHGCGGVVGQPLAVVTEGGDVAMSWVVCWWTNGLFWHIGHGDDAEWAASCTLDFTK
jgi:hypothetical protein